MFLNICQSGLLQISGLVLVVGGSVFVVVVVVIVDVTVVGTLEEILVVVSVTGTLVEVLVVRMPVEVLEVLTFGLIVGLKSGGRRAGRES